MADEINNNEEEQTYVSQYTGEEMDQKFSIIRNHKVISMIDRWLRFDPANKKGVIIKAGTAIMKSNGNYISFDEDTAVDFSEQISENGKDYFINLADNGTITANLVKLQTGVTIGRFHTLCVSAGALTMVAPASPSSGIQAGDMYLVKRYRQDQDPDFHTFYNKEVTNVTVQSAYDLVTIPHPLTGYQAGDILPESIFCLTWYPDTLYDDAMVYDKETGKAVDIYLQSGTGFYTRSAYNATHTVNRTPYNHAQDMRMVGKKLLTDYEFTCAALGSNEKTAITGASDKTTVGGHVDTTNRRMISAIGIEEACGYLWQWLDEIGPAGGSGWVTTDTHASFGQEYGDPYVVRAGGVWGDGSSCGSRARGSSARRSVVNAGYGGRGSSRLLTR